jgi:mono/diheme cytochrome c family protein
MLAAAPRLALALFLLPLAAAAQDAARGRMLYETYCGICHYERVHDRLRSDVKDLADLRDMVARWAPQTKRQFTLDELEDVVAYLNESHYRFGLPARRQKPGAP